MLGEETSRGIARELVETVRNNMTIDWTFAPSSPVVTQYTHEEARDEHAA